MNEIPKKVVSWILYNKLKTSEGKRFEFLGAHRFLIQPVADLHPKQTHRKASQLGFSESMIAKSIYLGRVGKLNIAYSMPSKSDMDDFHTTKFGGILRANPWLSEFVDGNSSKKIIRTKDGHERYIHLVGAYNSESEANKMLTTKGISFTADCNIHDESDRSDFDIIDQMQSRLDNSDYGFRWLFSNPTFPNVGTDEYWQKSDQMHWMVKCSHCGYRQYLDWFRLDAHNFESGTNHCYVDPDNEMFVCGRCQKEITDDVRLDGEWIARYPSKVNEKTGEGWRGYWYTQMMYVHHTAKSLLDKEVDRTPAVFSQMCLGKPYISSSITVTSQSIMENLATRNEKPKKGEVAMGVDGRTDEYQYVLRDKEGMFEFGRVRSIVEIEKIRDMYDAKCVIDLHPLTGEVKRFASKHVGKVWYALFKPESDQAEIAKFAPEKNRSLVLIRREDAFDTIADRYNNGEAPVNITNYATLKEFIDEYGNLVRDTKEDSRGNMRPVWIKLSDACDFPFADLYSWIALQKLSYGRMSLVRGKTTNKDKILPAHNVKIKSL